MSLVEDAEERLMSIALFIFLLSFSVYAGPHVRYRVYEYERVNVAKTNQAKAQHRLAPRPGDIGFRSYATELRPQRSLPVKSKQREFGF